MTEAGKIVVLAGATGNLGSLIADQLLDRPDVQLRVLVRPQSAAKVAGLREKGAEIVEIEVDSEAQADRLEDALQGAYSVISAIQGGPAIIVDAQLRLLEAARKAGARRFIPSNFSYNIFGVDDGDNINSDDRRAFARAAEKAKGDVEVVQIQNGAFMDRIVLFGFLGAFDLDARTAFLWGDGNALMDFTTYADTARFTVEVALDDEPVPAIFEVAGETLDFHGLLKTYEDASGKSLTVKQMGTLADLDDEIAKRREAEPANVFSWLPLMYWRALLTGKGKLNAIANDRYPHIMPVSVADYVKREGL
ncbi:NmrA family NAD(P)-binding protein [uncultured Martelella sp.]|uniref:NmrA family NAD(P)-binding protein n=1 Tax=uncultured Martelella sp. TaxID=392331 RepID=UPI0029C998C0|nr:NmrA family NAD(P)-binding protein [uncultured Martelella sp.]